jgi:hypothetical protein
MALDELLDSESTRHEWLQSCVSSKVQIDLPVAHHTEVFEDFCVGGSCVPSQKRGGKKLPDLELKHIISDFWVFTVNLTVSRSSFGRRLSIYRLWSVARCNL